MQQNRLPESTFLFSYVVAVISEPSKLEGASTCIAQDLLLNLYICIAILRLDSD